jgi:hypothetical protein
VEIPDEAVEAAVLAAQAANPGGIVRGRHIQMRAALMAARPYLMPTREQIAEILAASIAAENLLDGTSLLHPRSADDIGLLFADAMLALLNGVE